jgi:hypothetical protein
MVAGALARRACRLAQTWNNGGDVASITTQRRPLSRYRARPTARNLPPIPEQWLATSAAFRGPPPLWQFVFLSLLLHAMFIALFGAPSGGSAEGRAMWGSMQVELRGLLVEHSPPPVAAPPAEALRRDYVPPAPTRQDRGASQGAVPLTPPAETQAAATAPLGPAIVEVPTPFPRVIDRLPTREIRLAEPPALRVPPPTEGRDLRPPPRERIEAIPAEVPAPLPITPSITTERALADPPPLAIPLAQPLPLPAPAPAPASIPQPVERTPIAPEPRAVERTPAVEVSAIPVPALESIAPTTGGTAAPIELAPLPPIEAVPAAPTMQPAMQAPPAQRALDPEVGGPRFTPPGAAPGAQRRPGTRPGDTTSDYDPTAPSLDADALRARAGRIAREGSGQRALLPFPMPPVPEKKSQVESALENARKPDCRTAYQGLGLLAVVPLVANEFGEGNCRWTR